MSERTPRNISETAQWTASRIAERMDQTPVPLHPGNGIEGYGFNVTDPENQDDARTIGVFPEENVVTIATPDVSIKIRNATASAAKDGIRVDSATGSLRTLFLRDGHIALEVFPAPSLALPEAPVTGQKPSDGDLPGASQEPRPRASDDVETASQETTEPAQTSEQKERQPRIKFTGRLGADPHYEASQKSGMIVRFPVAEQTSEEHATWHRVYSTGKSAGRIQKAELVKGDKVSVDGYRQEQERDQKKHDGTTVKQEVVFAVHVKKLGQTEKARRSDEAPAEQS